MEALLGPYTALTADGLQTVQSHSRLSPREPVPARSSIWSAGPAEPPILPAPVAAPAFPAPPVSPCQAGVCV